MDKVSIMRMAMGAIEERVDYEMDRVIANIIDQNTKAANGRLRSRSNSCRMSTGR